MARERGSFVSQRPVVVDRTTPDYINRVRELREMVKKAKAEYLEAKRVLDYELMADTSEAIYESMKELAAVEDPTNG